MGRKNITETDTQARVPANICMHAPPPLFLTQARARARGVRTRTHSLSLSLSLSLSRQVLVPLEGLAIDYFSVQDYSFYLTFVVVVVALFVFVHLWVALTVCDATQPQEAELL